ncbi:hypothetical protein GCM10011415_37630 [Salipiger pallidus]|uniref:Uncharacterized protein n=1 Tax=Salipiger pallidus TaxID=1775170 RepID=A0A8J3EIA7_9RHOB|nr:hypothetical protein [Salipiger pallidus]GGG84063.1 hypothetical protein GCM10011415_37630 [Salipiger pallidus]
MESDLLVSVITSVSASYVGHFERISRDAQSVESMSAVLGLSASRFSFVHTIIQLLTRDEGCEIDGYLAPPLFRWFDNGGQGEADMICAVKGKMCKGDRHVVLLSRGRGFRETILAAHACFGISAVRSLGMAGLLGGGGMADMASGGLTLSRRILETAREEDALPTPADWEFRPLAQHHWDGLRDRSFYSLALSTS